MSRKKRMSSSPPVSAPVQPALVPIVQHKPADSGGFVVSEDEELIKSEQMPGQGLFKSIMNVLNGPKASIERLAFEEDPSQASMYGQLWRQKARLLPDTVIKRLQIQDDLVAAITNARAAHLSAFGRKREDRFGMGFELQPKKGLFDQLDPEQQKSLKSAALEVESRLVTCGSPKGWREADQETFSSFLAKATKNAIGPGRVAIENVWSTDAQTGQQNFCGFRCIDAGTIYRAAPLNDYAADVRKQALSLLEGIRNKDLNEESAEKIENQSYEWLQVIEGTPRQAFTAKECVVHNFYPVNDIELNGYPVTPLDTVITAVTTHINITTHNKMYFQTGRAARGMLVLKSSNVNPQMIAGIRQQFNASINNASNSWRMPVFGVSGEGDELKWVPIDSGSRDMEFQYLSDSNARVILSAFQMSPEELPGYAHLSRGTNNQALSESNNQYQLTAHRDVGLRPLVMQFEDFLNDKILPLFDSQVAKYFRLRFLGLDAQTAEKESIRLQQDAPIWMSYNDVLSRVEKPLIPRELGGDFPFNPAYQAILDKYFTVGQIKEKFFGIEGASKDPDLNYVRDQFWMTYQNFLLSKQQADMAAQQQPPPGGPPSGGGGAGADQGPGVAAGVAAPEADPVPKEQQQDAQQALSEAQDALSKGEKQLSLKGRRVLARHSELVKTVMQGFREEQQKAIEDILGVVRDHPKKPYAE